MLTWFPQLFAAAGVFDAQPSSSRVPVSRSAARRNGRHAGTSGQHGGATGRPLQRAAVACTHPRILTDPIGDVHCAACLEDLTD